VQTGEADLTQPVNTDPVPVVVPRLAVSIARGAALIAGLTLASRILGLGRTLVFSQTVGSDCLGTVYVTAYQIPNLISELVLAGALTNAMVPVLARSAERAGADPEAKARVAQISSAMLTWTIVLLVPVTIGIGIAAGPIATLLNPSNVNSHCVRSDMVSATSGMMEVFAPQILLYGLSVVLFGMLQAYRRFTGPALAPIVASLVLITSYFVFVPLNGGASLSRSPQIAVLVLSVGATLNVAALVLVGMVSVRRLGLRLRPTLRFPSGLAKLVSGLALVGILEFVANDLAAVVNIVLANGHGQTGALVVFNYAALVFGAVTAVLTLSITTSAFPVLSARDGDAFDRTCAGSTRAVLLMSWLGTAVVATVAIPAAHILVHTTQVNQLIGGFAAFAPGIAGTALIANLSRVMFALRRLRVAALALTGNWLVTILAAFVLTQLVPPGWEVAALAAGNTIGQTAVAIPLVIATRRIRGPAAVHGVGHAAIAGLIASAFACAAGVAITIGIPDNGKLMDVVSAIVAALGTIVAYGIVAYLLDRGDLRAIAAQAAARLGRKKPGAPRGRHHLPRQ
jgi:putative peptidoglycan lipid II flippase